MSGPKCRDCGAPFVWRQGPDGRWIPSNEDRSRHKCQKPKEPEPSQGPAKKLGGYEEVPF